MKEETFSNIFKRFKYGRKRKIPGDASGIGRSASVFKQAIKPISSLQGNLSGGCWTFCLSTSPISSVCGCRSLSRSPLNCDWKSATFHLVKILVKQVGSTMIFFDLRIFVFHHIIGYGYDATLIDLPVPPGRWLGVDTRILHKGNRLDDSEGHAGCG